jgi:hypothetical protein
MNKSVLKTLVGVIAVSLAICAAFFSVVGLAKLFAGAALAVIIMASTLEASKLVIASFLHDTWDTVNRSLKIYLVTALVIIASITSLGIYGFLSGAYQSTKSKYELSKTQSDSIQAKQIYFESSVATFKSQVDLKNNQLNSFSSIRNSQEQRASQLISGNRSSKSADRAARQTDATLSKLNKEMDDLNRKIIAFSDSASQLKIQSVKSSLKNDLSSELGSLAYISNVTGIEMDKIVNILICLFILVFDPLAICMVLAFNNLKVVKEKETRQDIPKDTVQSDVLTGDIQSQTETQYKESAVRKDSTSELGKGLLQRWHESVDILANKLPRQTTISEND